MLPETRRRGRPRRHLLLPLLLGALLSTAAPAQDAPPPEWQPAPAGGAGIFGLGTLEPPAAPWSPGLSNDLGPPDLAPGPASVQGGHFSHERELDYPERVEILRPELSAFYSFRPTHAPSTPLFLRFQVPGQSEVVVEAALDPTWVDPVVRASFDPARIAPAPGGAFVARTTPAGDAVVLRKGLPEVRPDLPVHSLDLSAGQDDRQRWPGAKIVEAGGVASIPYTLQTASGRTLDSGFVPVAARSSWMYVSGHYEAGRGLYLGDEVVNPSSVPGDVWGEHLKVLIFAACYAGEVAGQPQTGEMLYGRGLDGAYWWDKFRGTLLAYRSVAPTQAAPELTREFLRLIQRIQVRPEDRIPYSKALAKAWLMANWKVRASNAIAIDAEGTYYFIGTLDAPIPGTHRLGRVVKAVAQADWRAALAGLEDRYQMETPVMMALEDLTIYERGGKPYDSPEDFLATPEAQRAIRHAGLAPSSPEVVALVRRKLAYAAHIYYESERGLPYLVERMQFLAETEGPGVLTPERLREEITPPHDLHRRLGLSEPIRTLELPPEEVQWILEEVRLRRGDRVVRSQGRS
jgi:hypothetical protein